MGGAGVLQRAGTLVVAAEQHGTAAGIAARVDKRIVEQADVFAGHGHFAAAFAGIAAGDIEHAAAGHHAAVTAVEDDTAIALLQAAGLDHAFVVDHLAEHGVAGAGAHDHGAAVGLQQALVDHAGIDDGLVDLHVDQAVAVVVEGDLLAAAEHHRAHLRDHGTFVAYLGAEQGDRAAISRADGALVDHRTACALAIELHAPGHEVVIGDVQGAGHQAADVDRGAAAEQHTSRVDQIDLTVGIYLAHDLRGVAGQHAVERHRRGARLVKIHRGITADIEGVPGGDQFLAVLIHIQHIAGLADTAAACSNLAVAGQGVVVQRHGVQRHQAVHHAQHGVAQRLERRQLRTTAATGVFIVHGHLLRMNS